MGKLLEALRGVFSGVGRLFGRKQPVAPGGASEDAAKAATSSKAADGAVDRAEDPIPAHKVSRPKVRGPRRAELEVDVKNLTAENSLLGKILDPVSGVPDKNGKKRAPHILARRIQAPRLLRPVFKLFGYLPGLGPVFKRYAEGTATTPDFRKGRTRLRFALYGGAVGLILIFVITVQFPLTTNPMFCGSCHTQRLQFNNWRDSSHSRVTCYACHVSPGLWYLVRDHLVDGPLGIVFEVEIGVQGYRWDDSTALNSTSHHAQVGVKSARCLRCHDMDTRRVTPTKGLKIDHKAHMRYNISCTWCHNRVTHWRVPNHENFMTGQACFRCHYLLDGKALIRNGTPLATEDQLLMGLGLPPSGEHAAEGEHEAPAEGEHEAPAEGEHGAEGEGATAEGEHGAAAENEHGSAAEGEHGAEPQVKDMPFYPADYDGAGEIVTPDGAAAKGLTGHFTEGALSSSRGHGPMGEEPKQAYVPNYPVSHAVKEAILGAPIIGLPEVHIDYTKYAASGACNVCHVKGKL